MSKPSDNDELATTERLIAVPSVSGSERAVCELTEEILRGDGWQITRIPITPDRWCILAHLGSPTVLFSTHLDVVPGEKQQFIPHYDGQRLYGRGACDAKGVAASMMSAARNLKRAGTKNLGLLFVIGEEVDGIGAITARNFLKGKGIEWIVNGEPTEGKVMRGHKGHLGVEITCAGKACHSGYPHLGEDANAKLVRIAHRLLATDWGEDPELGAGSINIGELHGGKAWNVVSPGASLRCIVRTVQESNQRALANLEHAVGTEGTIRVLANANAVRLETFDDIPQDVAAFGTDIPHFADLAEHYVLFGPGSIHVAHTDRESISVDELKLGTAGYENLFQQITQRLSSTTSFEA